MDSWSGCSQFVSDRTISDHYPFLRNSNLDCGPKPFKSSIVGSLVKASYKKWNVWNSYDVQGWAAFCWNKESFKDIQNQGKELLAKINFLDAKDEVEELATRRILRSEFWKIKRKQKSLLHQKARIRWLREGDGNSKLFHSTINWRRRLNGVKGIEVHESWVEELLLVKRGVKGVLPKEVPLKFLRIFYINNYKKSIGSCNL
ncbi:hypothetical protein HKD37_07G018887 [Glycine soja]